MRRAAAVGAGLLLALAAVWLGFRLWPVAAPDGDPRLMDSAEFGTPAGASLVGVQPWLTARDYRSAETLRAKLSAYLAEARTRGWLTERSVAVFPEHAGTWLVAAGGPAALYAADTTQGAMTALAAAHPIGFVGAWLGSDETDRSAAAVFRMRSAAMARDYQAVFSALAAEYGVTIVAGSIVLENPAVEDGRIVTRPGALYNVTAVFRPDGTAAPVLVRKAYPIPSESPFTASAAPEEARVFDTPAGRLGVLICADSWHPDLYAGLDEEGADLLAVPAFLQPSGVWETQWGGYVTPWPEDVARSRAGAMTEGEAWLAHSMAGRLPETDMRAGMTAFLRGELWDLGSDGRAIAVDAEGVHQGAAVDGAAIAVLWLAESGPQGG